ncbi:hypothetical protein [uncultured Pseudodesulfovibrio sp.]|uniref:hypothetical protein n=1 Tax=uncultured Pseudodesulfovibrio sp. TaxID=2035858 RepID=UPI0029C6C3FD|nr:hypothetical protein [uncultured Pseudodesulfovibrio sp.]
MKTLAYYLLAGALLLFAASPALAQGEDLTQDELVSLVGQAVVEEAAASSKEVAKAKEILDAVRNRKNAPEKDVAEAQMEYDQARDRYSKAQSNLDNVKVDKLALQCGKTSDQIRAMRDSGMGWGRIAKECGGHGIGKGKDKAKGKNKKMMNEEMSSEMTQEMNEEMSEEMGQQMDDMSKSKGKGKNKKPKKK